MTEEKQGGDLPDKGKTPPQEGVEAPGEEVEQLRKEIEAKTSEIQKLDQNLKSAQGVARKSSEELQELRVKLDQATESRGLYEAMLGLMSQQTGRAEEDIDTQVRTQQPDLKKQLQDVLAQQESKRKMDEYKRKVESYQKQATDLGLSPSSKEYKRIRAFATSGDFEGADAEIASLEAEKTQVPKEEPKETEEERIERLAEEKARKKLEEAGYTKQETGAPSASSPTAAKIMDDYIEGRIDYSEFKKRRAEEGF